MSGPGTLLANRYWLEERLGGGGMGEVWRATDQVLGRTVAVKLMRRELVAEPGFADRFLVEARTMATIKHRGVVAIHDYHGDTDGAFLVMEHVEGESLAALLHRSGRLDPGRTMRLLAQAAEALQAAHDKGVVHRDIKPGNLLVTGDDTLVLTDFGIARSAASTPLTATGAVIGTPSYLSPEQVLGDPATPRSDLYALGVVAYECLLGRRPFVGENPFEVATKRLRERPPPMDSEVPAAVMAVVERALEGQPEQRWSSAQELAAAARQATTPGVSPPSSTRADYAQGRAALPPPVPGGPGADSLPAGGLPPAGATDRPAPGHAGPPTEPPPQPAGPVGPPAQPSPPPWPVRPPRPVVISVAGALLLVAAASMLLISFATLSVLEESIDVARAEVGEQFEDWRGAVGATALAAIAAVGVLGLAYLLVAVQVLRGRPGARGWAITLAVPWLCCCAPCWWFGQSGQWGEEGTDASQLADEIIATLPAWYQPWTGLWLVTAVLALLVALVLLMLPSASRYLRRPRPAFYYPYYPYYQGYPPGR